MNKKKKHFLKVSTENRYKIYHGYEQINMEKNNNILGFEQKVYKCIHFVHIKVIITLYSKIKITLDPDYGRLGHDI